MFTFNFPIKVSAIIALSSLLSPLYAAPPAVKASDTAVIERKVEATNALPQHEATIPASRMRDPWWKQRHEQKLAAAKTAKCDILFIGDSITQSWEAYGKDVWNEYYGKRNAFNIGFSGDMTQHVLWRLDNGEMAHFKPKVAVLMIGTNNTARQANWTAQKVADGVQAIIQRVHSKSPETQVLLLNVFPRGADKNDLKRKRNDQINALISNFHDDEKIHYLDISSAFLDDQENLSKQIMPDLLHPHAAGYKLWAEAMEPLLKKLLK